MLNGDPLDLIVAQVLCIKHVHLTLEHRQMVQKMRLSRSLGKDRRHEVVCAITAALAWSGRALRAETDQRRVGAEHLLGSPDLAARNPGLRAKCPR